MLPTNRRQQIVKLLREHGNVLINQLSQEFGVSEMTIHRDLAKLEEEGQLRKVRGGAVQTTPETAPHHDACFMCQAKLRSQTQVTLQFSDGSYRRACCPHCGLHALDLADEKVVSALVTDFLRGYAVNAQAATFILDPAITICCIPTVIAFQNKADARRFQKGFGGRVGNLSETRDFLQQSMKFHNDHK